MAGVTGSACDRVIVIVCCLIAGDSRHRPEDVRLDKTVAKITMPIPLGCYYLNRKITCSVRNFPVCSAVCADGDVDR
jgi:hypothetical protein